MRADPRAAKTCARHLIQAERHDELQLAGFNVSPKALRAKTSPPGVLIYRPAAWRAAIGADAVEITGLRNPCVQLTSIEGLTGAVVATPTAARNGAPCHGDRGG